MRQVELVIVQLEEEENQAGQRKERQDHVLIDFLHQCSGRSLPRSSAASLIFSGSAAPPCAPAEHGTLSRPRRHCSPRPATGRRGVPREPCGPAAADPHSYRRASPRSHPPAAAPGQRGLLWACPPSPAMQCPDNRLRSAAALKHRPPQGRMRGPCRRSGSGRPAAKVSQPRPTGDPTPPCFPRPPNPPRKEIKGGNLRHVRFQIPVLIQKARVTHKSKTGKHRARSKAAPPLPVSSGGPVLGCAPQGRGATRWRRIPEVWPGEDGAPPRQTPAGGAAAWVGGAEPWTTAVGQHATEHHPAGPSTGPSPREGNPSQASPSSRAFTILEF